MGLTLIDSLDTLLVMQLDEEAELALQWIEQSLSFGEQEEINLFEVRSPWMSFDCVTDCVPRRRSTCSR